jgi:hypothetical protein
MLSSLYLKINFEETVAMTMEFEKSTLKKVLFSFILVTSFVFVFIEDRLIPLIALLSGTTIGSLKLLVMGLLSKVILTIDSNNGFLKIFYAMSLLLIYSIIIASFVFGLNFFIFFMIGVLLINFVVFAGTIAELLGISNINLE